MKKEMKLLSLVMITSNLMVLSCDQWRSAEVKVQVEETAFNVVNLPANPLNIKETNSNLFSDFIYDVGPRFQPMTVSDLKKATSIRDFMSPETFHSIIDLKSVAVVAIKDDKTFNQQELGYTTDLTPKQLALLKTPNATLDFYIRIAFTAINLQTGQIEDTFDSPHYSVVPDTQATYANGKKALLAFLRTRGQEAVIIEKVEARKLQPAKLHFTVTKHGTLDHIRLDRSSNYPKIDQLMIDLIQQTPDHWIPAKNIKGEQVNQELVVSFGLLGC